MSVSTQEFYEQLPYPSYTHPRTHPERLAAVAKFMGMNPAVLERCRVLELGCGDGKGLISFAYDLKEAEFIGVDLGAKHIEQGNALIETLGLNNIRLEQMDVLNIDESFGEFDYIIAHGLFSWVPDFVREKILDICCKNLAPDGVCYISYNVYPGYHLRQMAREMMLFHAGTIEDPIQRATQSGGLLKLLCESSTGQTPYASALEKELQEITEKRPEDLLYDTLSDFNQPLYFNEFAKQADKFGLQYLSEIYYSDTQDVFFSEKIQQFLAQVSGNIIEREQYIDFVRGKRFRQTLLCHKEVNLNRTPLSNSLREFLFESLSGPESPEPDLKTLKPEKFIGPEGEEVTMSSPAAKTALVCLLQALPGYLSFDELCAAVQEHLGADYLAEDRKIKNEMGSILLELYRAGLVELHLRRPRFASIVSDKPFASRLVREQLKLSPAVTTLTHINIFVTDVFGKTLLQLLDGTRNLAEIQKEMEAWIERNLPQDDAAQEVAKQQLIEHSGVAVKSALEQMARMALLEA